MIDRLVDGTIGLLINSSIQTYRYTAIDIHSYRYTAIDTQLQTHSYRHTAIDTQLICVGVPPMLSTAGSLSLYIYDEDRCQTKEKKASVFMLLHCNVYKRQFLYLSTRGQNGKRLFARGLVSVITVLYVRDCLC